MHNSMKSRLRAGLAASAAFAIGSLLLSAPAVSDETFSTPSAPTTVSVSQATGGLKVTWKAVTGVSPAVTHYVVSGGAGSCPVIVPASMSSAVMPAISRSALQVSVQAVNAYGFSDKGLAASAVAPKSVASSSVKSVQLLQFSDFHGAIESTSTQIGAAVLAGAFKEDRENVAATFTVSSGDNVGAAPPISGQFSELPTIFAMNGMGVDVSGFGNHEHDRNLQHVRQMMWHSNFKWVASNYSSLDGLKVSNAKKAESYTILDRGGVKVGFIGINTDQTAEQIFPGNLDFNGSAGKKSTITISANLSKAQAAVDAARRAGADIVVALVHEGWNQNADGKAVGPIVDVAGKLKNVAAVYGAHSHQTYASLVDGKLTAQVRNSGTEYTRTQLCVNTATNSVIGSSVEHVKKADVAGVGANGLVAGMVGFYKAQLNAKLDVKIGQVATQTARGSNVERSSENDFGSWMADVVRAKYGVDIALLNGGGIRDRFPANGYTPADKTLLRPKTGSTGPYDVTLGDAYTINPFGNTYSTTVISGEKLWAALENGVSNYPADGRFPQVSGIRFTADVTKAKGSRIVSVTDANGVALPKDAKIYTIATLDFIAYGGDGYTQFDVTKLQIRDLDANVLAEALQADMAAGKITEMKTDGRITIIK